MGSRMQKPPHETQLVTLARASRLLGIPERRLYDARDRGEVETYRFSSTWNWIRWGEACAWFETHRRARRRPA